MNGYPLDQFTTNMDDYICGICKEVCRNASVLCPCGHLFCNKCIVAAYTYQIKCPTCREVGAIQSSPWHIQKINGSMYRCKYTHNGCTKIDAVKRMSTHESTCEYESLVCIYCNESLLVKDHDLHHESCTKKPIPCSVCTILVPFDKITSHPQECIKGIMTCVCGETFERGQLPHHRQECPKEVIQCPYIRYGCSTVCSREEMKDHELQPFHIKLLQEELDQQVYPGEHAIRSHHHSVRLMSNLYNHRCNLCHDEIVATRRFITCVGYHCVANCDFDVCMSCFRVSWDIPRIYNPAYLYSNRLDISGHQDNHAIRIDMSGHQVNRIDASGQRIAMYDQFDYDFEYP